MSAHAAGLLVGLGQVVSGKVPALSLHNDVATFFKLGLQAPVRAECELRQFFRPVLDEDSSCCVCKRAD